ncbi:uncharacterized protein LOC101458386 [Ceratitis capitata]|uniref:Ska2 N-terminal domain-containing protein n=1 Tax=Ceratitis capitata TaxID=7213 RepID=W8BE61_CERCA|nr:uncharacterized protein LOC101458386 [Ceratitis capitata]
MDGYQDMSELEKSVAHAGTQLYTVAHKLHEVETTLDHTSNLDDVDGVCVMELLESMEEVKAEYHHLVQNLREVHQLQRDVTTSIRFQMRSMQQTFESLKKRIELRVTQN